MPKAIFTRSRSAVLPKQVPEPNNNDRGTRLGGGVIYPPKGGVIYNPHPFTPPADPVPQKELFKTNLEQVQHLASTLTPKEKKELLATLALEAQPIKVKDSRDLTMWAGCVLSSLEQEIGAAGSPGSGPLVFERLISAGSGWAAVQRFMVASKMQELKVIERQGVYHLLSTLLVKHAKQVSRHTSVPLTPRFLATCSANIGSIFDAAFPGYMASGLAHIVAKRMLALNLENPE
jgi:hypothetical protein